MLVLAAVGCDDAEARQADEPPRRARQFRSEPVDAALEAAAELVRTRGFAQHGDDWRGFVVQRETEVMELPMKAGQCYLVVGAGSSALGELDLGIYDGDGSKVVEDGHEGGRAAVHYCPPQSGIHYLGVRATSGNGLFAVRRFRGPTGLDVRMDDLFPEPPTAPSDDTEQP